jgi:ABC-type branched-subunit amino acid transport system substrate-binding protein
MRNSRALPVLIAAALLAATIGLAACGDDGGGGGEQTLNLKIGDIIPLTGDLSPFGPPGRKAANLAVAEINKAIQAAGVDHTVTIQHEDEQTKPQPAVEAARKLADAGASCIAGAWASTDSLPVARSVTIREKILQITPASTSAELTPIKDDGFLNRIPPADNLQGPTLASTMDDQLGGTEGKTVNIGNRNDSYGEGLGDAFADAWKANGGKVGQRVQYDPAQPSFNSEAERIASGNPDAFVIVDFPETYDKVGPALVRTGNWDPKKTFVTDGLVTSKLPKSAGLEAVDGLRGTVPGSPEKGASSVAFNKLYNATAPKNIERGTFDSQNFDAVILCYLAAVAAGSTDGEEMKNELRDITGPPGTKYSWEQLPEAIKALQDGKDIDYVGAAGEINLDENGDPTEGVYDLLEYKGAELIRPIKQVPAQEAAEAAGGTTGE